MNPLEDTWELQHWKLPSLLTGSCEEIVDCVVVVYFSSQGAILKVICKPSPVLTSLKIGCCVFSSAALQTDGREREQSLHRGKLMIARIYNVTNAAIALFNNKEIGETTPPSSSFVQSFSVWTKQKSETGNWIWKSVFTNDQDTIIRKTGDQSCKSFSSEMTCF